MKRLRPGAVAFPVLFLVAACSQQRVAGHLCPLPYRPIAIGAVPMPLPPPGSPVREAAAVAEGDFAVGFAAALATPTGGRESASIDSASRRKQVLVLSGGGKWGAFGAGVLGAWAKHDPGRSFKIVTGVSTGALQSSFASLGTLPVPATPPAARYPASLDFADIVPGQPRTYYDDIRSGYTVSTPFTLATKPQGGLIGTLAGDAAIGAAIGRGAASDLAPLRRRLDQLIDSDTFARIGLASADNRFLYVALVDMDRGDAIAVDMTRLAAETAREAEALPPAEGAALREARRQCYLDVLIAASSEPLPAPPVFIDVTTTTLADGTVTQERRGHMFMDAGLRYGVFLEEVLAPQAEAFDTTIIVNGRQRVSSEAEALPTDWDLFRLGLRSKDLLVHQIYEFSIDRVRAAASSTGGTLRLMYALQPDGHVWKEKTCEAWRAADKAQFGTDAFPPNHMKCLIDYGAKRATANDWDIVRPADRPVL